MASATTLRMFPAGTSPQTRPARKGSQKWSAKEPDFEMVKFADDTHEVVIAIEEIPASTYTTLSAPPKAEKPGTQDGRSAPRARSPLSIPPAAMLVDEMRPITPPNRVSPSPTRSCAASLRSHTSSPTLVRSGSVASTGTHSPVMRSMFPRYDPRIPLSRQRYYPTRESNSGTANRSIHSEKQSLYSPSLYSQLGNAGHKSSKSQIDTPNTIPAGSPCSPFQAYHDQECAAMLSTPEELLDLWSIANGQGSQEALGTYTLGLTR